MKKNKIAGLLIAAAGSIASISTAAALYVKKATNTGFGIGATWSGLGGTINYKVNDKVSGSVEASYLDADGNNGGEGYGGVYTQAHYVFRLSAGFVDAPAQNYVVGNFKVDLSNIAEAFQNNSKIWVGVSGYTDGTYGKIHYASCFMNADQDITGATYSVNHDLTVSSTNGQTVDVYVKLNSALTEAQLLSLAEGKAFDISVSWGAPVDFDFAYVVGKKTMWKDDGIYAMTPNINKEGDVFEWCYNNLSASMEKTKCHKVETSSESWSKDDYELTEGNTYDVYWSGTNGAEAYYTANPIA